MQGYFCYFWFDFIAQVYASIWEDSVSNSLEVRPPLPLCCLSCLWLAVSDRSAGLKAGLVEFIIMIAFVATGSMCVALSAAEMSSMLPFAGGAYGYVRCALGPSAGFIAGFSEAVKYTLAVVATVIGIGYRCLDVIALPHQWTPLGWTFFYFAAAPLLITGGRTFWNTCMLLALFIVVLMCTYCIGAIPEGDISTATNFIGNGDTFMEFLCQASIFFAGFNAVTLTCSDVKEPTKVMPWAYIVWVATALVMAFSMVMAGIAMPPYMAGVTKSPSPLKLGLGYVFGIPDRFVLILVITALFSNALGYSLVASRQIRSMANSGLFPSFLNISYHGSSENTPIVALLSCWLIGYLTLTYLYETTLFYIDEVFQLTVYGTSVMCILLMRAYVVFHSRYSNLDRAFVSPLGLYGAYFGMITFISTFISVAFYYDHSRTSVIKFTVIMAGGYAYYLLIARRYEFFSVEEQKLFMKAYIVNAKKKRFSKKQGFAARALKAVLLGVSGKNGTVSAAPAVMLGGNNGGDMLANVDKMLQLLPSAAPVSTVCPEPL